MCGFYFSDSVVLSIILFNLICVCVCVFLFSYGLVFIVVTFSIAVFIYFFVIYFLLDRDTIRFYNRFPANSAVKLTN